MCVQMRHAKSRGFASTNHNFEFESHNYNFAPSGPRHPLAQVCPASSIGFMHKASFSPMKYRISQTPEMGMPILFMFLRDRFNLGLTDISAGMV